MRALLLALVACHHAAAPPDEGEMRALAVEKKLVGKPAPALTVTTLDGKTIDLATLYGQKPVYLKFWATWCIPCKAQMPRFEKLFEQYGDQVSFLAVNVGLDDDPTAVRAFRDQLGMKMPLVVDDGRLADTLALEVTPQHVLVGRDGRVAYVGHQDGERLDAAFAKVIADKPGDRVAPNTNLRPVLQVGDVAPMITDHKKHAIELFATWCEDYLIDRRPTASKACTKRRTEIDALRAAHADVVFEGVSNAVWTSQQDIADYAKLSTLPIRIDADGATFRAFDVHELGTVVLIGSDGKVARIVKPADDLRSAVEALQ
ncbi:MAG: TlpA disulfide reductase family protein [Kofleriaceae bacterium]